jgi:predicted dehydrogenase
MIGLDTSHCVAFTRLFNDPKATGDVAAVEVVAAFPGGSDDIPASRDRIEGFTKQMREAGVEIVGSIDALLPKVDVVLLESVDGRPHLEQARPVIAAGKPLFIDKPLAGSLADAIAIFRLAEQHKVPVFSSSSLRFSPGIAGLKTDPRVGEVVGCTVHSPCSIEPHHPDLFWYGVHGVEMVYTIMGEGCQTVVRTHTDGADVVTGVWQDGRVATYRGIRGGKGDYGGVVYGTKGIVPIGKYEGYAPLCSEIAKFFRTREPPIAASETIELFAFMEAADESKRQGGKPVAIADVMARAEKEAAAKFETP